MRRTGLFPRLELRRQGLRFQLLLFIILPLTILLIAIPIASLTLHAQAMRVLVGERDARAAEAAAAAVTEQLTHRAAAMRGLALQAATSTSLERSLSAYAFLLPDFDGGLAFFAADGMVLAASDSPDRWHARPVTDLLARTRGKADAQFSATFIDPSSGGPMVMVAATSPSGPTAMGAFSPASLVRRTLAETFAPAGQASLWLVDRERRLLFAFGAPSAEPDITQHPGVTEALQNRSGTRYLSVGTTEHVVAYSPVAPLGWALVMEEPWEAVDTPWLRRTQAAPLILIPVVLFALVALGFGYGQIVQPLRSLEQKAAELAWGRFEAIEAPVGGIAEIRRLQAELAHMARKVQAAQQSLRDYAGVITAGQEDERRRLARELHDGAVQALVALDQRMQLAQLAITDETSGVAKRLAETRRMTASLIEEVRRVIRALRPIYLEDLGLASALEMLAQDTSQVLGIPVAFSTSGQERRLPTEVELTLYRMMQEALSNIARHAQASRASVRLAFAPDHLALTIQDNGRGFTVPASPAEFAPQGHFGLLGLHERAELIGARLAIHSTPGAGTTVDVTVPL